MLPFRNTGKNPKQPYAGSRLARHTCVTSTRKLDHPRERWIRGQTSEPPIPAILLVMPMTTSDVAGIFRDVFAKSMAVDVIVVKPTQ